MSGRGMLSPCTEAPAGGECPGWSLFEVVRVGDGSPAGFEVQRCDECGQLEDDAQAARAALAAVDALYPCGDARGGLRVLVDVLTEAVQLDAHEEAATVEALRDCFAAVLEAADVLDRDAIHEAEEAWAQLVADAATAVDMFGDDLLELAALGQVEGLGDA